MIARSRRLVPVVVLLASCALAVLAPNAFALGGATGTWVSGVGDDANPCSRTAPCKTFAGAISKTADFGEIRVLDPGGYGSVTITRGMTINGDGTLASILHTGGATGIVINAGATDDVLLRSLTLHGGGDAAGASCTGNYGVRILGARSVTLQHVVISEDNLAAILVAPSATNTTVVLDDVQVLDNCGAGVDVTPTGTGTAKVLINDTTITRSGNAVVASTGGAVTIVRSTIFGNPFGLVRNGTGTIDVSTDSTVRGNGVDGTPSTAFGPIGPQGPQGPAGVQGESALQLLLATSTKRLTVGAGGTAKFTTVSTAPATATVTVTRGTKQVGRFQAKLRRGGTTISWASRVAGKPAGAGMYSVLVRAVGADGQVATSRVSVFVRAARRA